MARPMRSKSAIGMIKMIHVAKRQLALDDETYRGILEEATGKTSCSEMDTRELELALTIMERGGFVRTAGKDGPKVSSLADDPQSKKLRHLWLSLHELGQVRNPSESALNAFVRRMTRRDRLEWISIAQASQVIEHLKQWILRVGGTVE